MIFFKLNIKFSIQQNTLKISSAKCWPFYHDLNKYIMHWYNFYVIVMRYPIEYIVVFFNSLRPSDAWSAPSHYLNQCWNIVNWTLGNKIQRNLNRNWYIFFHENAFENIVRKSVAILSQPQCVNPMTLFPIHCYCILGTGPVHILIWIITVSSRGAGITFYSLILIFKSTSPR